jgi:hypothetical protein
MHMPAMEGKGRIGRRVGTSGQAGFDRRMRSRPCNIASARTFVLCARGLQFQGNGVIGGGHLSSVSVGKLSSTSIVALGAPPPVLCHEEGPLNFSLSSFLHGDTKDTISSASCCHLSLSLHGPRRLDRSTNTMQQAFILQPN